MWFRNTTLMYRSSWRYYLKRPLHLFFSVFGVALGVALVVGIDMASQSARHGFSLSSQSISGKASHRIINSEQMLPESIYTRLRNELGLRKVAPLIKQTIQFNVPHHNSQVDVQLIGIDPFSEAEIRIWQQDIMTSLPGSGLQRFLTEENAVLVENSFLKQYQLHVDDVIEIVINDQSRQLVIAGSFKAPELYQTQLSNWLIGDISTVQELLNFRKAFSQQEAISLQDAVSHQQGAISQIDLVLDAQDSGKIEQIKQLLPAGAQLVKADEHTAAIARLTQSFELNLKALSFLGLLVAMFLIYNTMMFSVVQRRDLLARMRVLGVSRKEIFQLVLTEALVIAVLATTAGLILGIGLAHILLYFVTRTINDLYYVLQVTQLHWSYFILFKALALGIGATLLSALLPAFEAAYTRPVMALQRSHLETKIHQWSRWLIIPGLLASLLVYWLLSVQFEAQINSLYIGFTTVFITIGAFICLLPLVSYYLLILIAVLMKQVFKLPGKIAVNNIIRSFSRSIIAIAALTISVASALGIGIMVESFRYTVDDWLSSYLKADYYISSMNNTRSHQAITFDKQFLSDLSHLPGLEYLSTNQETRFFIDGQYHQLMVFDIPLKSFSAFHFKEGDAASAQQAWFAEDAVIISEPYAYRHGLSVGDTISLPVSTKIDNAQKKSIEQVFKIVGVYFHYGSEQGLITMNRSTYERYWPSGSPDALGLYLSHDSLQNQYKREQFEQQLETIISGKSLQFISKQNLQNKSLIIFDRTFKITNVLKLLVILVSFVGILSALMAIELERSREFAILRATGLTGRQLSTLVYIETLTMGIIAAILAIPMGIMLAYLLIEVINYRSFGWSMQFILPWREFVMAAALALLAAFLAAVYPAWHLSRTRPALALRGE